MTKLNASPREAAALHKGTATAVVLLESRP